MAKIKNKHRYRSLKNTVSVNKFQEAVDKCPDINGATKSGISAMGSNSKHVQLSDTYLAKGSVDIDSTVKHIYPNDSRWDYVIGYADEVYFVEIHPAETSNITEMIKKVKWLKQWLSSVAPDLKNLHKCGVFHWIPSGRMNISIHSSQYRRIAINHLLIKKSLHL